MGNLFCLKLDSIQIYALRRNCGDTCSGSKSAHTDECSCSCACCKFAVGHLILLGSAMLQTDWIFVALTLCSHLNCVWSRQRWKSLEPTIAESCECALFREAVDGANLHCLSKVTRFARFDWRRSRVNQHFMGATMKFSSSTTPASQVRVNQLISKWFDFWSHGLLTNVSASPSLACVLRWHTYYQVDLLIVVTITPVVRTAVIEIDGTRQIEIELCQETIPAPFSSFRLTPIFSWRYTQGQLCQ